jgi:hypothetical protein
MACGRTVLRHVFEDLAEIAEADGDVDALGDLVDCTLAVRHPLERIVQVDGC